MFRLTSPTNVTYDLGNDYDAYIVSDITGVYMHSEHAYHSYSYKNKCTSRFETSRPKVRPQSHSGNNLFVLSISNWSVKVPAVWGLISAYTVGTQYAKYTTKGCSVSVLIRIQQITQWIINTILELIADLFKAFSAMSEERV